MSDQDNKNAQTNKGKPYPKLDMPNQDLDKPNGEKKFDKLSGALNFQDWKQNLNHNDDNLLLSLSYICEYFERDTSVASLTAGLPLQDGALTPDLFVRAASRAGISAKVLNKELEKINKMSLPCVLVLKGNKACIATEYDEKNNSFTLVMPESGDGQMKIGLEELSQLYDDYAIFVKPMYKYDSRSNSGKFGHSKTWLMSTLSKFWPIYSQVIIAAVLINLCAVITPLFAMSVYDLVVPNNAFDTLMVLTIGILLIYGFDFILKSLRVYFIDIAGKNADIIISSKIYEHLLNIKQDSIPTSSGIMANEVREYETIREFFSSTTLMVMIDLPFLLLALTVIYYISSSLAVIPLIFIPFVLLVGYMLQFPLSTWVEKGFKESNQRNSLLIETINGIEAIKTANAQGQMQRYWEALASHASESNRKIKYMSSLITNVTSLLQQLSYVSIIVVGASLVADKHLTMGAMIGCTMLNSRLLAPVSQLVGILTRLRHIKTAIKALDKILSLPTERNHDTEQHFIKKTALEGNITFENVTFSYPEQENSCLKDLSFKINKGEKVVVVGKIGSGKSTIQRLIMGTYQANDGLILLDGNDIRQIDPDNVRANIGFVSQNIYLFNGTVKSNITLGMHKVDDQELLKAATISGVIDFVNASPYGFDMPVLEGGCNLSAGQRQSIALARALIKNPSLFLFDEPFSNMDIQTADNIMMRLMPFISNKTIVLVTHKPNYMQMFKRMILIHGGKVAYDGDTQSGMKQLFSPPPKPKPAPSKQIERAKDV